MKKTGILLLILLVLLQGLPVFADENYQIDRYHVDMKVNEQNVYFLQETIDVKFLKPRRGIFRIIPMDFYGYAHKISDISITDEKGNPYPFTASESGKGFNIRIGDPNVYLEGEHRYVIRYRFDMGDDRNRKFDQVYFNLLGTDSDIAIPHFSFSVTLPKEFPENTLKVTRGRYGSTQSATWQVKGLQVIGEVHDLKAFEGVTFRVDMPEGYFHDVTKPYKIEHFYIYFGLLGGLILIAWLLRLKNVSNNRIVSTLNFYPPDGLNPAELAYIYGEEGLSKTDLASMILYWASRGFLKIEKPERAQKLSFLKVDADISEMQPYEKSLYESFFRRTSGGRVTRSELKKHFYEDLNEAEQSVREKYRGDREILVNSYQYMPILVIVLALIIGTVFIGSQLEKLSGLPVPFNYVFTAVILLFIFLAISWLQRPKGRKKRLIRVSFFVPLLSFVAWVFVAGTNLFISRTGSMRTLVNSIRFPSFDLWALLVLISLILTALLIYAMAGIKKYTPFAREKLSKIYGFREFLEKAKTDEIETMFSSQPSYYYDMLPYVYVLGLTKIWDQHLQDLTLPPPTWYESSQPFNTHVFFHNFNTDVQQSVVSPSSSGGSGSSGSFGGGGFSGGGGGGGSVGSW